MPAPSLVVLAAGLGTRLGRPFPKPLAPLRDGRSILQRQWDALTDAFPDSPVHIVVGFKKELVMEALPDAVFVYNPDYSETNTSKSLLRALRLAHDGGVLWLNGDVVFDRRLLELLGPYIDAEQTVVCTNHGRVGDEEIKYTLDEAGNVRELSKHVAGALGEAIGINFVAAGDRSTLLRHLEACGDDDYFERGLETAIAAGELVVKAVDVSAYAAIEVDTEADLDAANASMVASTAEPKSPPA
jgi:CDP-glycerol glycerophosphotransferase